MKEPGDNGRRMRTIEFDEADAPMLAAAMRLAGATCMAYGAPQAKARERFKHYRTLFMAFAPPEASLFQEEETWCEIAIAMDDAPTFSVEWKRDSYLYEGKGRIVVRVGNRAWETGHERVEESATELLAAALARMAPSGCERTDPPPPTPKS